MKRALTFVLTVILVLQLTTTVFAGAEEIAIQIAKQKYSEADFKDVHTLETSNLTYHIISLVDKNREIDVSWDTSEEYTNVVYAIVVDKEGNTIDEFEFYSKYGVVLWGFGKTNEPHDTDQTTVKGIENGVYLYFYETYKYRKSSWFFDSDKYYPSEKAHLLLFNDEGFKYFDIAFTINGTGMKSLDWLFPILKQMTLSYPDSFELVSIFN